MKGTRADQRLVELGLAPSREKARALIMEGMVSCDGVRLEKPGAAVGGEQTLYIKENALPYVSRGGLKLEKAIREYGLELKDKIAVDVGASTGGFTDCMLKNGAKKVYAIDVGYGQLDWRLRSDARVKVMERTNARFMTPEWFDEIPQFASVDVSFISVRLILPGLVNALVSGAWAVVLVKPQFEAGRGKVGKNGVVRAPETHREVLLTTARFALDAGFAVRAVDFSPITGPKGNIEFLLILQKNTEDARIDEETMETMVDTAIKNAHDSF
ncbi:MAG: TlyA family RNA methyltransferase [Clostridiaceae bacterium]|nr:TlyA family RNA methyltransferase [Eubacteriales bacterium]